MTVTSRLHRQKDKERQRKTEEKVERRPVVTPWWVKGSDRKWFRAAKARKAADLVRKVEKMIHPRANST